MVGEMSAIFVSTGMYGLFSIGTNRLAFNLGYEHYDSSALLLIFAFCFVCNIVSNCFVSGEMTSERAI